MAANPKDIESNNRAALQALELELSVDNQLHEFFSVTNWDSVELYMEPQKWELFKDTVIPKYRQHWWIFPNDSRSTEVGVCVTFCKKK